MKIFIDSADTEEVKKYLSAGLCDGVTTNPTICLKCGVAGGMEGIKRRTIQIAKLIEPRPMSVEVTSENPEEILQQARDYAKLAENIAVKITITDREGKSFLPVIQKLVSEGVRVNVTAMTTFNQAILAAKAIKSGMEANPEKAKTPHFISIFAGRISEEQGVERAFNVLKELRNWLDFHQYKGIEIIVGSVRTPENVEYWSRTGAHILTIPPEVIAKSLLGARTKETVAQFINDAKKSMEELA
ncbi:transaldolase [Patescibacteria group bacterium]|nr:transaldolase [Patescibacteria group bacterium]MBU4023496.1 transaldolase [Patescibacteria group bacterium]